MDSASPAHVPVETVNFHIWQPCNMRCLFCFATFQDVRHSVLPRGHLPQHEAERVVARLAEAGFSKITFAGGEPLLCPWIVELVSLAKSYGLTTALVTNGSLLSEELITRLRPVMDWITLSVDSARPQILRGLGRQTAGRALTQSDYLALCRRVRDAGFWLKINTVVTAENADEDLTDFIIAAHPIRWKIFQVLPIAGQNSGKVDRLLISHERFQSFVSRNFRVFDHGIQVVPEDNDAMTGSYAMVDPAGRFFDDVNPRGHTYSDPILKVGVARAVEQIRVSRDKFLARGGLYRNPPQSPQSPQSPPSPPAPPAPPAPGTAHPVDLIGTAQ
jgi:radical S-adenosyl methionine domain-containing protein 2